MTAPFYIFVNMAGKAISRKSIVYDIIFNTKQAKGAVSDTQKGIDGAAKSADNFSKNLKGAAFQLAAFATAGVGLQKSFETIKDFEKALSSLSAITGATGKDLEFFKQQAIATGKNVEGGATSVVKAFEIIGSAKPELLKSKDALAAVTKEAITLAQASGLELPQAADALTGAMNQFNAPASEASRIINILAAGSKEGAAAIPLIAEAMGQFGTVADSANVTIEQSTALIEVLAEKNIKGSRAGIQLRNIILKLQAANIGYVNGQFDLVAALDEVRDKNLSAADSAKLFGLESVTAGNILVNNTERLGELTEAVTGTSVAYEQAETQTANLAGALTRLSNSWQEQTLRAQNSTSILTKAVDLLADNLGTVVNVVGVVASAVVGYRVAVVAAQTATAALSAASVTYRVVKIALARGIGVATVAMRGFNTVTKANPIGLIVGLVSAAASAFLLFRDNTEQATEAQDALNVSLTETNTLLTKATEFIGKAVVDGLNPSAESTAVLEQALIELNTRLNEQNDNVTEVVVAGKVYKVSMQEQRTEILKLIAAIEAEIQKRKDQEKAIKDAAGGGSPLELLRKEIASTKKALEEQALAGNLSQATLDKYKAAVDRLETSQRALKRALGETGDEFEKLEAKGAAAAEGTLKGVEAAKQAATDAKQAIEDNANFEIEMRKRVKDSSVELVQQTWAAIVEIQQRGLQRQLDQLEAQRDHDLALAGENEQEKARINERFAEAQARLRRRIAISEKAAAVFEIGVNTAKAVAEIQAQAAILAANPATALFSGAALAQLGILFASAALQTALVVSQPLPAFAKGTKNAPEGFARVGEQGEEIVYLPQGAQVMDNKRSRIFNALQDLPNIDFESVNAALATQGLYQPTPQDGGARDYSGYFYRQLLAIKGNKRVALDNTSELAGEIAQAIGDRSFIDRMYD